MIQVPDNYNKENTHYNNILEPHLQDLKSKNNDSFGPSKSDERKTSSYESCRGLLNSSYEFVSANKDVEKAP